MMEPFSFERTELVSDGRSGRLPQATTAFTTLGEFTPIKAKRNLEAAQIQLKAAYTLWFWNDPCFIPASSDTVRFRGKAYTIQTISLADENRLKYQLTLLEQGK